MIDWGDVLVLAISLFLVMWLVSPLINKTGVGTSLGVTF